MRTLALPLALALATLSVRAQQPAPKPTPAPKASLEVGAEAPKFRVNDDAGKGVAVGGAQKDGTWTVLAFYPKAATPG